MDEPVTSPARRRRRVTPAKLIVLAVSVAAVVAVGAATVSHFRERERTRRMPKIIASFDFATRAYVDESDSLEREVLKGEPNTWRELSDAERRWLIDEVSRQLDFTDDWKQLVIADSWGRPLRVEVRKPDQRLEFRITCAGPDGVYGNDDDLDSIAKNRYVGERVSGGG